MGGFSLSSFGDATGARAYFYMGRNIGMAVITEIVH